MNAHKFARKRAAIARTYKFERQRKRAFAHLVSEARAQTVVVERRVVGWKLPNGETVCVKTRYPSELQALTYIDIIEHDSNTDAHKIPVRAYRCPWCHGFHLTSQGE